MQYIGDDNHAEENAARLLREWGFPDARTPGEGPDGGIDVRATGALAQVKYRAGLTGRPEVQKLFGARGTGDEQLFFFTATGYSDQAVEYADEVGIALFVYDPTGKAEAVNKSARAFASGHFESARKTPKSDKFTLTLLALALVSVTASALVIWSVQP